MFAVAGSQLYTSTAVLEAGERIIGAASLFDDQALDQTTVDLALLEATTTGMRLNDSQAALVRQLATSGRCVQLAITGGVWEDGRARCPLGGLDRRRRHRGRARVDR